ncbi:uncharacterized protein [Ranitomeya imitator]|uniref:uncharacterized protein n=1 Tax=Ranitomeya imitator TaxID=111125 RepID=UPI0037E788BC
MVLFLVPFPSYKNVPYPGQTIMLVTWYVSTIVFCLTLFAVLCTGCVDFNMDYRAKERSWLDQMDQVFSDGGMDAQQPADSKWDDKLQSIKAMLLKRSRLWWNRMFLEKYIRNKMVPRGLRVRILPSFPIDDNAFITQWEEACTLCSTTLMQLLVDFNTGCISDLDKSIDLMQAEVKMGCPPCKLQQFESDLEKSMDAVVKKIQDSQTSKFNRDNRDYLSKRVYLWRTKTIQQSDRAMSNTSLSSQSGRSDVSSASTFITGGGGNRLRDHTYHPYKRNNKAPKTSKRDNKVINLSSHTLSDTDMQLLERGLSFSPTSHFDLFSTIKDLHLFARSLLFRRYHFNNELHLLFPTEEEQNTLRILEELAVEHMHEVVTHEGRLFGCFLGSRSTILKDCT